jgi:hypothetical protein
MWKKLLHLARNRYLVSLLTERYYAGQLLGSFRGGYRA